MSFSFGNGGGEDKGEKRSAPAPAINFSGSGGAPAPVGGGFGFGAAAPAGSSSAPAFSFGGSTSAAAAPTPGAFSFGGAAASVPRAADAPAASFGFGGSATAAVDNTPAGGKFDFGGSSAGMPAPSATGFNLAGSSSSKRASFSDDDDRGTGDGLGFSFGGSSTALSSKPSGRETDAPTGGPSATFCASTKPPSKDASAPSGFGVGGGATAPSASSAPGGFSFCGAGAAAGAPPLASKPAPGGFNLGGSASGAPKPADGASALSKPSETPEGASAGAGGFGFGGSSTPPTPATPAPVATPAQTGTPASHQHPNTEPPTLEYQTLTVEQIMNKFQQELEKDAMVYLEEARRISEYDAILRDTQRDIAELTQQTHRRLLEQKEVEQTLMGIVAFQEELERTLEMVEGHVDELFAAQSNAQPVDADIAREKAYNTATNVEQRLQAFSSAVKGALEEIEETQERVLTGDVGKIIKILNQHELSLAEVQATGRRMEHDLAEVSKMLSYVR